MAKFIYIFFLLLYSCGYPDIDSMPDFKNMSLTNDEKIDLCNMDESDNEKIKKCIEKIKNINE